MTIAEQRPDLGAQRRLSPQTLALFNVHHNGAGWEYDTRTMDGKTARRWKSYFSTQPEDDPGWKKYKWLPSKPESAKYFYPPGRSLSDAVRDSAGALYLVGGDIGVMSLFEAGIPHVTCTFGDGGNLDTLAADLAAWGVTRLYLVPDRDDSGVKWAMRVRDALRDELDILLYVRALPYDVEPRHGRDVNDFWRDWQGDADSFRAALAALPAWRLPEPEPVEPAGPSWDRFSFDGDENELPAAFVDAIERALGDMGGFNGEGWSRKHVRCPLHDDARPSANWNRTKRILRCQSTCGKSYLAKDVGEALGIRLADFRDRTPAIAVSASAPSVGAVATGEPRTTRTTAPSKALRPPLPPFAQLDATQEAIAASGRNWLDTYIAWAQEACPLAPDIFHEALALWLLATVSTRRMRFAIGGEHIYPNLYVLIVGMTSLYRKTTAMKGAIKLLKAARLDTLLLPEDATPEALFDELAGVKPSNFDTMSPEDKDAWLTGRAVAAQRAIFKDEASSVFANLRKEYMAGLAELLLQGYDSDAGKLRKLLKGRGLITVKDLCISFLGATTPVMFVKHITNEETENGFLARFAVVTPEGPPIWKDVDQPVEVPGPLVAQLRHLFLDVLPWHHGQRPSASRDMGSEVVSPPVMSVMATQEALKQMTAYRKALNYDLFIAGDIEESKAAAYARLGTMLFKVAMLLAAIDTAEAPIRIEARHAYAAQQICERWRESLHRLDRELARVGGLLEDKIHAYLKRAGETGAALTDIKRDCGIKKPGIAENALNNLGEEGVVEKFDADPERKGKGRKPYRYRIVM